RDRKQSIVVARETLAVLPDLQAATEDAPRSISTEWVYRPTSRIFLRVLALVSLISVSANTPNTFQSIPLLAFLTFGTDVTIALIFTAEMLTKMKLKGIFKGPDAFFKQTWSKFDVAMIIFLWISVALHSFEVKYIAECANPLNIKDCVAIKTFWLNWGWLSILRCPRPLILLRVFRAVIQFQLPKTRLSAILHQNVTLSDLPSRTRACSSDQSCPNNMRCVVINDAKNRETSYAGFDNFHMSFFTVYQAACSQRGLGVHHSVVYFVSMIFFLAWLVKNVFIAVLIETCGSWSQLTNRSRKGYAPRVFLRIAKSTGFNVIVMLLVLANSFVAAGVHFNHDRVDRDQVNAASMTEFQVIENIFTILFDIEAVFKVTLFRLESCSALSAPPFTKDTTDMDGSLEFSTFHMY
uniref:Ion_trans domain-containing protein n=1 Tax=Macrostomum lignano TaxID=282301 RepID=A0A1I8FS93_9PLAT